jgi:hypothetical protein
MNIFETPWPLAITALAVLSALMLLRIFVSSIRRWWAITAAVTILAAAFAFDILVTTDREAILRLVTGAAKAVERTDCAGLGELLSGGYADTRHRNKEELLRRCGYVLDEPFIKKSHVRTLKLRILRPEASIEIIARVVFEKDSMPYRNYKPFAAAKLELHAVLEEARGWRVSGIEIKELDGLPANWQELSGLY